MKVRLEAVGGARSVPVVAVTVVTMLFAHHSRFVCAFFIAHVGYARMFIHSQNSGGRNRTPRKRSATQTRRGLIARGH
jgi:hypothetical protein